jgi:hypothetical protein
MNTKYLSILRKNLNEWSHSKLGIEFTLRHHNAVILEHILEDLEEPHNGADGEKNNKPPKSNLQVTPHITKTTFNPEIKVQMRILGKVNGGPLCYTTLKGHLVALKGALFSLVLVCCYRH